MEEIERHKFSVPSSLKHDTHTSLPNNTNGEPIVMETNIAYSMPPQTNPANSTALRNEGTSSWNQRGGKQA